MPGELTVLLIDDCPDRVNLLDETLTASGYRVVAAVEPADNLHAVFERYRPDIILVDMESPDRDTLEHMRSISDHNPRPIVMFTNDDDSLTIQRAVRSGVTAYVVDTLSAKRVRPVLDAAIARFEQFQTMRNELDEARSSLADRKVIERAKGILMSRQQIDEPTAYRALQKMAMNRNQRIAELARNVISAADLLG